MIFIFKSFHHSSSIIHILYFFIFSCLILLLESVDLFVFSNFVFKKVVVLRFDSSKNFIFFILAASILRSYLFNWSRIFFVALFHFSSKIDSILVFSFLILKESAEWESAGILKYWTITSIPFIKQIFECHMQYAVKV